MKHNFWIHWFAATVITLIIAGWVAVITASWAWALLSYFVISIIKDAFLVELQVKIVDKNRIQAYNTSIQKDTHGN